MIDIAEFRDHWIRELGLAGWDIEVKFVHRYEIDDNIAQVYKQPQLSRAVISLAYPEECENYSQDIEQTLVHELLHIRFWGCDFSGTDNTLFEAGIDKTATALVRAKRGLY